MSVLHSLTWHLYQSFLMRDRLSAYRDLLGCIAERGYTFSTVADFAADVRATGRSRHTRVCVLRIDIDSDPRGATRMFEIAEAHGIHATYYFRLSTLEPALARRIRAQGSEAGYHFEELATFAKRHGLRTAAQVDARIPDIRAEFRRNIMFFRDAVGELPRTIAAHGDFLNRRLRLWNNHIVTPALLEEFGIVAETRDDWLIRAVTARISDRPAPRWWHPRTPFEALAEHPPVLYLLVHPRQWARAPLHNAALDFHRAMEEAAYLWRTRQRPQA